MQLQDYGFTLSTTSTMTEDDTDISHPRRLNKTIVMLIPPLENTSQLMDQKTVAPSLETLLNDEQISNWQGL